MTQPSVRLVLANPYPVALSGTLTLGVNSGNLAADAAVQFATGGRSVAFVIPANQTEAVFGTQGTRIGLQTGTVASDLSLTPTFATQAGNIDLTPPSAGALQFGIAAAPPQLATIQLINPTADGFTIQVTGFTTTRSLTNWNVQFTTAEGFSMPVSEFTLDVKAFAAVWFQTTASQAFGGQFRLSVPFTFQGAPTGQSSLAGIRSVSVTIRNESGASNALQANRQ
jgi:hypothetical protein